MITILQIQGATCTGCRLAIETYARRADGVQDFILDNSMNQIQLVHSEPEAVDDLIELIKKIGYNADIIAQEKGEH